MTKYARRNVVGDGQEAIASDVGSGQQAYAGQGDVYDITTNN